MDPPTREWQRKINHHAVMGSRHSRKTLPVIPAKAGIHNKAPIIKQPTLYIMASKAKGVLYTGVTSNLKNRTSEHRTWLSGNSDE